MKKTASIFLFLLALMSVGMADCKHYISGVKMSDQLKSVFFQETAQFSDNLLVCIGGYWESDSLLRMQKKNQKTFKRVVEKSYFLISDIQPSQRSEIQSDFLDKVEVANAKFATPDLVHLYSSRIAFATVEDADSLNTIRAEKEEEEKAPVAEAPVRRVPAKTPEMQGKKKERNLKNDFQRFLDSFKKSSPSKG